LKIFENMLALQEYIDSDEEEVKTGESQGKPEFSVKNSLQVCAAPLVLPTVSLLLKSTISRHISYGFFGTVSQETYQLFLEPCFKLFVFTKF
jgi:hypothetical protein